MSNIRPDIAIFTPTLAGGVGTVLSTLVQGLLKRYKVEVVVPACGPSDVAIPGASLVVLGTPRTIRALWKLVSYLLQRQPKVLLSAVYHANIVAIWAHILARSKSRLVISEHIALRSALNTLSKPIRFSYYVLIRLWYRYAAVVVAVSQGAAEDLIALGVPRNKVYVIYNPVISEELFTQANQPPPHEWLRQEKPMPVILGVGRLSEQKDFSTLINAFARLREHTAAKLIILGEGEQRQVLENLIHNLDLNQHVYLAGQVNNPYPYFKHANVFVLSSRYEGLPTVLIEALALGVPVVSTDCPSGPREILQNGKLGTLVPVGDKTALASAIHTVLASPVKQEVLTGALRAFTQETSVQAYERILFP